MSGNLTKLFGLYVKVGTIFGFSTAFFNILNCHVSPFLNELYHVERKIGESDEDLRDRRFAIGSHSVKFGSFLVAKSALYGVTWPAMMPIIAYHSTLDSNDFASHFILGLKYSNFDKIIAAKNRFLN